MVHRMLLWQGIHFFISIVIDINLEQAAPIVDEQAFVFEDTDTADLETELNVEEDSSYNAAGVHEGEGYEGNSIYLA